MKAILVLTDDQRLGTVGAENAGVVAMPHTVDEIVSRGLTFPFAFMSTPFCGPSRAELMSGLYAHNNGVLRNDGRHGGWEAFSKIPPDQLLQVALRSVGVRTGLIGKFMNGFPGPAVPVGWDDFRGFMGDEPTYYDFTLSENGVAVSYGHSEADYATDVLAAKAVNFIHAHADEDFFLYFAPGSPHADAIPALRHANAFPNLPPWRPPSFNVVNQANEVPWVKALPALDPGTCDAQRLAMLRCNLAVDDAVEAICNALRQEGIEDETLVIFTSDNGMSWGEHRWFAKQAPWEECVRFPMYVRWPAVLGNVPQSDGRLVQNIDLAPTLLEAFGALPLPECNGSSLMPVFTGAPVPWRSEVLFEHWPQPPKPNDMPKYAAVRTATHKLVVYSPQDEGSQLYDLVNDPFEQSNRTNAPGFQAVKADLMARLVELQQE